MLQNPFSEDLAASKGKRQQLDRLLRVTTPHERFMLAGIGLLLCAGLAWTLFGSVTHSIVRDGILLGTSAHGTQNQTLQALLYLSSAQAQALQAPAPVSIEITLPDGSSQRLPGEVTALRDGGHWLLPAAAGSPSRVEITLPRTANLAVAEEIPCRLHIVLGRRAPVQLFLHGWTRPQPPPGG